MIAVAGFNTSIDKLLQVDELVPGSVLRARDAAAWPGGKGVHVALAAAVLGEQVRLAGLIDRAQHHWFRAWLAERGVDFVGVEFSGPVRTCLTIHDRHGRTTEIREPGPAVDDDAWCTAVSTFESLSGGAAVAVLSGSVPPGVAASSYRDIVSRLSPSVPVLVDAAGDLLRLALAALPLWIKPNREEAEALTGMTLDTISAAARAARVLSDAGARVIVLSLGEIGAVASWDGRVCHGAPPSVTVRNAVGAGDCLVAGVAAGVARGLSIEDTVRLGVACGTAKVLSPEIGLVRNEDVRAVLPSLRSSWLE